MLSSICFIISGYLASISCICRRCSSFKFFMFIVMSTIFSRVGNGIVKVTPSSDLFFLLSPTPAAGSTAISSFSFLFGLICGRGPRAGGFKGFPNLSVSMSASRPCWYTHWLLPA
uniref:Uncharacterized protein n=1 Tax=Cacopsylla melanoneura TaxID=428564 RepID=A0A8D8UTB3_9HEMI